MTKKESIPPRDGWITLMAKQRVEITPDVVADYARRKIALRQTRGNIIAYSLDIEFAADVAIRELLISPEPKANAEFKEKIEEYRGTFDRVISKSGAVTFNNKIKILKTLLQENQLIGEGDSKRVSRLLDKVKAVRNKFAHTTIAFEPKTIAKKTRLAPYIIEGGKRVYLDDNYFDELNKLYSECLTRVENITRAMQKIPLEPVPKEALAKESSEELVS